MIRPRCAATLVASALFAGTGCLNLCDHPLFSWLPRRSSCASGCCEADGMVSDGPILGDYGAVAPPPATMPAPVATVPPTGPCQTPQLAPAPRLVPQPQTAPTMPYSPPQ
jgi:hypothetical protein